jgi:hypothetical protein
MRDYSSSTAYIISLLVFIVALELVSIWMHR